jgi:hypothetical protein
MNNGWFVAAALAASALCGCGGGQGAAPAGPAATPIPSPPSLSVLGYALQSGGRSSPRVLDEYPMASTSSTHSFQEFGGAGIRFDPSGTLWSDQIGGFTGYHPDGSSAGTMNVQDALRAFDARGMLYAASCCSINVYVVGIGNAAVLLRSISTTPSFACSAAADGAGNLYVAFCTAAIGGSQWTNLYEYGPNASGSAAPIVTNTTATGPVTVDDAGNVYAPYNGAIGIWPAGTFSAGAPARTLPIAPGNAVTDIAADRAGNVYAITRPVSGGLFVTRTLLYFAAGSATAVTLQSGQIGSVAAVP